MSLSFLYLLSTSFNYIFPFLSLLLLDSLNGEAVFAGLITAFSFLVTALIQPQVGQLIDQGRIKIVTSISGFILSIGIFLLVFDRQNIFLLIIASVFFIAGNSIVNTCTGLAFEGIPAETKRSKSASIFAALSNLGQGISAVFAFYYLAKYKKWLLLADWLTTLLLIFILYVYLTKYFNENKKHHQSIDKSFKLIHLIKSHATLFLSLLFILLTEMAHLSAIPYLFSIKKLPVNEFTSFMFVTGCLVVVMGSSIVSKINIIKYKKISWMCSAFCLSLGHALMPIANNLTEVGVFTIIWATGETIAYPLIADAIYNDFSKSQLGLAASFKTMILRISLVISPVLGALIVRVESSMLFSIVYGLLPLIGCGLFLTKDHYLIKYQIKKVIR